MQTQQKLFTNRMLLTLLWPLVVEQALNVLVGMSDTVMVSSVGEAAISGVSLVDMINYLILNIFAALATGGAVITSQFLGAKKPGEASRSAGQLVTLSSILGTAVMALCLLLRGPMLRLFFGSIADDVFQAAMIYFTITAISYPFLALYNAGAAIFRSVGNSEVSMRVSVIMNITNIVGNAFCIFVLRMGVAGVAVPTLVSRVLGAVIILKLTTRHDNVARVTAGKQPVPAGACAGRQYDLFVRHGAYFRQCGGQQPGRHGLHCGPGHRPCHDHCGGALCGRPTAGPGQLLYQKAAAVGLHCPGRYQCTDFDLPEPAAQRIHPFG